MPRSKSQRFIADAFGLLGRDWYERAAAEGALRKTTCEFTAWTLYGDAATGNAIAFFKPGWDTRMPQKVYDAELARRDPEFARLVADTKRAAVRRRKRKQS